MAILVTGGAGYIGSVTVELLRRQGEAVVVVDNLSRGFGAAVDPEVPLYDGDVGDRELIARITSEHSIEACIHFAAFAYVGESVEEPDRYYQNNVAMGMALLDGLLAAGVKRFVFSSTCSTYGEPQYTPIDEKHPQSPTNPYGWTKLFMERVMKSYDQAYGLRYVALRYFNACGAIPERGEAHQPETHIIPLILEVAGQQRDHFSVFGSDYPTADGTAVRDYIHVADLASAHILALERLRRGESSDAFNLGTGTGHSVLEVVKCAEEVTGRPIAINNEPRRPGDPSELVAAADKAREVLGWQPQHVELADIIRSAWDWYQAHPDGYGSAARQ